MLLNFNRFITVLSLVLIFCSTNGLAQDFDKVPLKGIVTMIDLGAKKCIPCKMMAPILEKLKNEYKGKADIVFIDVWQKQNIQQARRFKIKAIPTQIFFNEEGEEVFRHVGFFDEKSIIEQLTKMEVEKPAGLSN